MSGPAQRAAERQAARRGASTRPRTPSARGTGSAKPSGARAATTAAGAATVAGLRARPNLTGRAVVLAGVLALIVFTLAVPVRELISQRAEINALRSANDAAQSRVDDLVVRQDRLADPAYITSLVRERLHYVLPGEVGYVVLDPSEAPAPTSAKAAAAPAAWYATLWKAVQTTDSAGVPATTPIIPVRPNAPR